MNPIKKPTPATKQKLYSLSGNECAFPNCNEKFVVCDNENTSLGGQIAHIHAANKNGPRFKQNMTSDERRDFSNLILLCGNCHKIIDDCPKKFTANYLKEIKIKHQKKFIGNFKINTNKIINENLKITLIVVEDPSCVNCQVDLFVSQIKDNLISDLEVVKINFDSAEGEAIVASVGAKQVPNYLFSESIDAREDWEKQLKGAFISQDIGGVNFYMLDPQFVQNKAMITNPPILEGSIVIGDENAPLTVMQFTDFECPYCAIADGNPDMVEEFQARSPGYVAPMPKVYGEYVDAGLVKVVFYNFPIASLHPEARKAHNAVLCANEQGEFEVFSHKLWFDRDDWISASDKDAKFKAYAAELGLDETQFNECYNSNKYDYQITKEMALGQELGVSGTPAFFIGKTFISGAQDYESFKAIIDAQLETQN